MQWEDFLLICMGHKQKDPPGQKLVFVLFLRSYLRERLKMGCRFFAWVRALLLKSQL